MKVNFDLFKKPKKINLISNCHPVSLSIVFLFLPFHYGVYGFYPKSTEKIQILDSMTDNALKNASTARY